MLDLPPPPPHKPGLVFYKEVLQPTCRALAQPVDGRPGPCPTRRKKMQGHDVALARLLCVRTSSLRRSCPAIAVPGHNPLSQSLSRALLASLDFEYYFYPAL